MGYYTRYTLKYELDKTDPYSKNFELRLWEYFEQNKDFYSKTDGLDWGGVWSALDAHRETITWYSHIKDMLIISKKFPTILFILEGVGEEQGDVWIEYFKDGQHARIEPIITWPTFNTGMFR